MTTPPGKDGKVNPSTLVAANEAGADEIYKVGGAQAIAALAYGTESISKVDKIVGPGIFLLLLQKKQFMVMSALIPLPDQARFLFLQMRLQIHDYVAADLLSQAEHDEMASAILITTSEELARKVSEVNGFVKRTFQKRDHREISG